MTEKTTDRLSRLQQRKAAIERQICPTTLLLDGGFIHQGGHREGLVSAGESCVNNN